MPSLQPASGLTHNQIAYSRLIAYAHAQWPGYRDAAHHRLIARKLEAVERGEITRLMIFMPPRHGKSMLASEFFPAWYLGRNPSHYVIAATYAQELADDFGRKVRNQIADVVFSGIFPGVSLRTDSTSSKRFHVGAVAEDALSLSQDGAYYAVGVGGPLTGRGAHLLLIDDPVKNREEAESEIIRKKTKDWYTSTAYTRLMPGGRIVIIQTRWHEDDLSGWQLREHMGEGWDILSLPAINSKGDALWPEQYDIDTLNSIRRTLGPRDWSALYQQAPAPEEGTYFLREWLKEYDSHPPLDSMRIYGASDYAVTEDGGDYTVHIIIGIDKHGQMWLLDLWRKQAASDVWIEAWCELVKKWHPSQWGEESGQINAGVGPFLVKLARERGASTWRRQFPSRHDKAIRARSIQGRMAMGGLNVPRHAPWLADFIAELVSFPSGRHDDQVDALGLFGQLLDLISNGREPEDKPKPPPELVYKVLPSGVIQGNMTARQAIDAMIKRKRREGQ